MLSQYEENLKNERLEKGQLSEDYENKIQMLNSVRAIIQVLFSDYHYHHCERFESRSHLISGLSMTVQVRLVLNRTVVDRLSVTVKMITAQVVQTSLSTACFTYKSLSLITIYVS